MKRHLLLLSLAFIAITAFGQNPIPNWNFEAWTSSTYDYPQNYPITSNQDCIRYSIPFNVTKITDAYHGTYAVQLTTNTNESAKDTAFGYFINTNPDGNPSSWTGGMPYSQKPTGIRGYYKYNVATADSGTILVAFSKGGLNIGSYFFNIGGIKNDYTLFHFTFIPALSETPDSVIFAALSCKLVNGEPLGVPGSTLLIDSVSFTGVSSQPTLMNGDFESWQTQTSILPDSWYLDGGQEVGVYQTTDAVEGQYAIELKTYLGNTNNHPAARAGRISTGYYPNNCNDNCNELGGYPFSNQNDTLTFYYKYNPSGSDSATVSLNFKKDGANIGWGGIKLLASSTFQYKEIPFNVGQTPDTVIIDIQSSSWNDTLLSFIGSDLIVDAIHFKSQVITKTNPVITWANPDDITYGTLLSATQLNATADVVGTFVYTPAIGTLLSTGNSQTLRADFTPTDATDYNSTFKTVTINVLTGTAVSSIGEADIKFYPNPVTDNLFIESPESISSVIVTNIVGIKVLEKRVANSTKATILVKDLNSGLYFISIRTASGSTIVKKFLVKGK